MVEAALIERFVLPGPALGRILNIDQIINGELGQRGAPGPRARGGILNVFFAPDVWAGFLVLPDPAFARDSPRRKS